MNDQPIETTATEVVERNGDDVGSDAPTQAVIPATPPTLAVAPQVEATELVKRLEAIKTAQSTAMEKDIDYGVIPGTDKPTLFKPGAEKLSVLFQLDVQLANEKQWGPGEHLTVISRATVFHAPTGARLGYGEGICTTRERKYAYRQAQRVCPDCGEAAVIKGKAEYGGGWLCWKKRDGCGAKWADGDQAIEGQEAGEIDNPDLPDLWNTVVKMAEKRARVDAVLAVTGASALFTQDVEDRASEQPPTQAPQTEAGDAAADAAPARSEAPKATARERKGSVKPITGEQKGKINARLGAAGLTKVQASVCRRWWMVRKAPGVAYFDRLSAAQGTQLIRSLAEDGTGAIAILNDLLAKARDGNEAAQKLEAELEAEKQEAGDA